MSNNRRITCVNPDGSEDFAIYYEDGQIIKGHKGRTILEQGYILAPYITRTTATYINGEMVWHESSWVRLKIWFIRLFKPKYFPIPKKMYTKYSDKPINKNLYSKIFVDNLQIKK